MPDGASIPHGQPPVEKPDDYRRYHDRDRDCYVVHLPEHTALSIDWKSGEKYDTGEGWESVWTLHFDTYKEHAMGFGSTEWMVETSSLVARFETFDLAYTAARIFEAALVAAMPTKGLER